MKSKQLAMFSYIFSFKMNFLADLPLMLEIGPTMSSQFQVCTYQIHTQCYDCRRKLSNGEVRYGSSLLATANEKTDYGTFSAMSATKEYFTSRPTSTRTCWLCRSPKGRCRIAEQDREMRPRSHGPSNSHLTQTMGLATMPSIPVH